MMMRLNHYVYERKFEIDENLYSLSLFEIFEMMMMMMIKIMHLLILLN